MKKTKKLFALLAAIALFGGILAGCGEKNKLAEGFDEETVKQQAQADIDVAVNGAFEDWQARFTEAVKPSITKEMQDQLLGILEDRGEFKEFGKAAVIGQEQNGQDFAVAVVIVKYDKKDAQYTVSYDKDMKLVQFLIK